MSTRELTLDASGHAHGEQTKDNGGITEVVLNMFPEFEPEQVEGMYVDPMTNKKPLRVCSLEGLFRRHVCWIHGA